MKKLFSVSIGIVIGVLSFLIVSYAYKLIFSPSTSTVATFANRSAQFSGRNFGSGARNFGSGGRSGMIGSGNFGRGTGRNGTGNFRRGSGAMMGTGRRNTTTGTISAQELFNQNTPQQ
ncbi:MAG: hypothetical protein NT085_00325 [candidate division SR1 bacterium]|nr:hypothetical protein [candidate division SR1 bacterium]